MVQATCETYCSARPACSHYIFRTHSWMGADNQQIRRSSSSSRKTKEGYCWLYQTNTTHANGNEGVEGVERNKAAMMVVVVNASDPDTVLCTRQDDHHTHNHNHVSVMASMLSEFADDLAIIFSGSIFASSKGGAGAGAAQAVEGGEACQL